MNQLLKNLGYRHEVQYNGEENRLARVIREHKGQYTVQSVTGSYQAVIRGKLYHEAQSRLDFPAVGDWLEIQPEAHGQAVIHRVLPRYSAITRKVAGYKTDAQLIATNITKVFLVVSAGEPLNKRKLERYLSVVWECGASPVIVISKVDLVHTSEQLKNEVTELTLGLPVLLWSAATEFGKEELNRLIAPDDTIVLMGSSGVGKSSLLNALFEEAKEKTGTIREQDQRGKHTTTHRELHVLPKGGVIIDTPGMKELQLWSTEEREDDASFSDILNLKQSCRFSDCTHKSEPGCAILEALANHALEEARWLNYQKLQREQAYAERKQNARLAAEQKKQWKKQTSKRKRDRPSQY